MIKEIKVTVALLAAFSFSLCLELKAGTKRDIVATVGEEKIDVVEFEAKVAAQERGAKRKFTQNERQAVLQALVNQRLLVAEAKDKGLEKKDELRRTVDDYERQLLASLVFDSEVGAKTKVSEDEVRKFFDSNPKLFEVRQVSQILIQAGDGAEKKAALIKGQVTAAPKTFSKVAKLESADINSKAHGGDLGLLRRGMLLPDLEKAVFEAKTGSVVGPVKTEFGFHILRINSIHQQTYAEAKEQLSRDLNQKSAAGLQQKLLDELSKKYKVSFNKDKS